VKVSKDINKIGYFWLPSDPENKLAGILNIQDGGNITLELLGVFGKNPSEKLNLWYFDVILGDIEEYGEVTLIDSKYSKSKKHGHAKQKNNIECDYALIGAFFENKEELQFKNVVFRVEGLNAWTAISFIDIKHDENHNPIITHSKPQEIDVNINEFCNLKFIFGLRKTWLQHALAANDHAEIHQDTYLMLFSEGNYPFSDFFTLMTKIANFFIFAINHKVSIEEITVQKEGLNISSINKEKTDILKDIKVFTNKTLYKQHDEEVPWNSMMFRYRDTESFENTINKWLNMYNIIEPSLELYFSVIFSKDDYVKSHFLMLVQSLEGLHRRLKKTDVSLINRLRELFKEFIDFNLYSIEEIEEYIIKIKDTRHYLSHYFQIEEDKIIKEDEYEPYINTLILLLQIHFLKELGFDQEQIYHFLNLDRMKKEEE